MQKRLPALLAPLLAGALAFSTANPLLAQTNKTAEAAMLKVGDVAPDFKMQYVDGEKLKEVSLREYRGKKNVIVAFYIFAFTGG